jgi:hypothetical protein
MSTVDYCQPFDDCPMALSGTARTPIVAGHGAAIRIASAPLSDPTTTSPDPRRDVERPKAPGRGSEGCAPVLWHQPTVSGEPLRWMPQASRPHRA